MQKPRVWFLQFLLLSVSPISCLNRLPKNPKNPEGDHSNFEFLGCESMQGSPGGAIICILQATLEKFEIRVIALSGFFGFFGKRFKTRNRRNRGFGPSVICSHYSKNVMTKLKKYNVFAFFLKTVNPRPPGKSSLMRFRWWY